MTDEGIIVMLSRLGRHPSAKPTTTVTTLCSGPQKVAVQTPGRFKPSWRLPVPTRKPEPPPVPGHGDRAS
jgi:hypothetical protein